MSYRKHPTRAGWWQIIISQGKKQKQKVIPIEGDEAYAILMDKQLNAAVKGERLTVFPTISEALPDYLVYYKTIATEGIVKDFISVMRRCILPMFGKSQAVHIIAQRVYQYTSDRLADGVSHRTIEKELAYLKAMTNWMFRNGLADRQVHIPLPPKAKCQPQRIQQPLTADEIARLLEAVPERKRVLILLMSDAGLRMSEALNLEWADVDVQGCRITVRGKGGKVVVYPVLTKRLEQAISRPSGQYVCINEATGLPYGSIKTLLRLASKRAGITKRVTHHTLRHSFSTLLMESGISAEVRQRLMRHSSLAATQHYTHLSPEYMRKQAGEFTRMIDTPSETLT